MKLEAKNVKTFKGHDGVGINADIYADGKKAIHVFDSAHGGSLEITPADYKDMDTYKKAMEFVEVEAARNPKYKDEFERTDCLLNDLINKALEEQEKKKAEAKFKKQFFNTMIFMHSDDVSYYPIAYGKGKSARPLKDIPAEKFKQDFLTVKAKYEAMGYRLLNDNITPEGVVKP